jgi:hypothetical protein
MTSGFSVISFNIGEEAGWIRTYIGLDLLLYQPSNSRMATGSPGINFSELFEKGL